MNFLDRAIEYFSPETAFRRERYRYLANEVRSYEAASKTRRTANWKAPANSQNDVSRLSITTVRQRSRQLVRDVPYASRAVKAIQNNVVGRGIRPSPWADGRKEKRLKELWKLWAESAECDYNGKMNMYGLQRLAMRSIAESGEVIIVKRYVKGGLLPFRLQILEADHLDHGKDIRSTLKGTINPIYMGVEFGRDTGRPANYWLYESHPAEGFTGNSKPVPADSVLHLFEVLRPGQVRGVPFGVSAFIRMKDIDEFEDARLMREKVAAAFGAFVHGSPDAEWKLPDGSKAPTKMEPGTIQYLTPGQEITFPTTPTSAGYSEYMSEVLHAVAVAYGVNYEILTSNLKGVNYSSGKLGWLEFQRNVEIWQDEIMISQMMDPVWNWFFDGCQFMGLIAGSEKVPAIWTPPMREMVDPEGEVSALKEQVRSGFITQAEAVKKVSGMDLDDFIDAKRDENKKLDDAEIKLDTDPRAGTGSQNPAFKLKQSAQ